MLDTSPEYYISFSKQVIDDIKKDRHNTKYKPYCLVWKNEGLDELTYKVGGGKSESKAYGFNVTIIPSLLGNQVTFDDILASSITRALEDNIDSVVENFNYDSAEPLHLSSGNTVYLYGVQNGSNRVYHIGPFTCSLAKINIDFFKENSSVIKEKVSFTLIPDQRLPNWLGYEGLKTLVDFDLNLKTRGNSKNLKLTEKYCYGEDTFQKVKGNSTFGNNLPNIYEDIDYHLIIKDVIKDALYNLTKNPNIIVLLPDINVVCRDKIEEYYTSRSLYTQTKLPENEAGQAQKNTSNPAALYLATRKLTRYDRLKSFCDQFNLDLKRKNSRGEVTKVSTHTREQHEGGISYEEKSENFFNTSEFFISKDCGKASPAIGQQFTSILGGPAQQSIESQINRLKGLLSKVNAFVGGGYNLTTITIEPNTSLTDFWKSNKFNNTDIQAHNKTDPHNGATRGFIIVGDQNIINDLLYQGYKSFSQGDTSVPAYQLHPIDSAVFGSKDYEELFNKEVLSKVTPSFREYFIPNFILAGDYNENSYEKVQFVSKSFSLSQNELYRSALDAAIGTAYQSAASLTLDIQSRLFKTFNKPLTEAEIEEFVGAYLKNNELDVEKAKDDIKQQIQIAKDNSKGDTEKIKKLDESLSQLLQKLNEVTAANTQNTLSVDAKYLTNRETLKNLITTNVRDSRFEITLTTDFPCHHLGTYNLLTKVCLVSKPKSTSILLVSNSLKTIIDTQYRIIGYTHKLKRSQKTFNASSEFKLIKNT